MKAAAFPICAAACFRGIRRRFSSGGCIFSSSGFSRLVFDLPLAPLTICTDGTFCILARDMNQYLSPLSILFKVCNVLCNICKHACAYIPPSTHLPAS